jgi:hypothetical protein
MTLFACKGLCFLCAIMQYPEKQNPPLLYARSDASNALVNNCSSQLLKYKS